MPAPEVETTSNSTPASSSAATAPAISVRFGAPPPSTSAIVMLRPFSSFDYATKIFCQSPEPVEYPARVQQDVHDHT